MGALDHSDEPDELDQPERHSKPGKDGSSDGVEGSGNADRLSRSAESESRKAERLGLATLTRDECYESQRSQADAQEAALRRRDAAASIDQSDQSNEPRTDTPAPGEATDSRQASEPRTDTQVPGEAADSRSAPDTSAAATDDSGAAADDSGTAADDTGPGKIPWGRSGPKRDAPDIGGERWWAHPPEEKPERDVEIGRGYYWTEVPRFLADWQHHKDRWSDVRRREVDQSIDPKQLAEVTESVEKVSEVEPPISDNLQKIEEENVRGGWLEGFEFRLKGHDRLIDKVAEGLETSSPDATLEDLVQQVPDAIRYTFCLEADNYTKGYLDIKDRLESCGYEMYFSKNSWTDLEYKGINTRWVTQEGQRFEVQFHTPESFHAKHEVTHEAYERLRNPLTTQNERRELSAFQREVSSWIPVPNGIRDIANYMKKGF